MNWNSREEVEYRITKYEGVLVKAEKEHNQVQVASARRGIQNCKNHLDLLKIKEKEKVIALRSLLREYSKEHPIDAVELMVEMLRVAAEELTT